MRNILIILLIACSSFTPNKDEQITREQISIFKESYRYDNSGAVVSFDYGVIYKQVGEKGIEAFLNTQGYTITDNAAYIRVQRDHYRSGDGCNSLGEINGYRQFLGTTIGIYGCNDGFTLSGNWSGFKITNTNAFGFSATGTLFKAGAGLLFSSRFFAELNISLPTGAILADFTASNFNEDELFQLKDGQYVLNGSTDQIANTAALIPNITAKDSKTLWEQNVGLEDSYKPFSRIKGEDGLYYELYIDNTGTLTTRTI